MRRPGLTGDIWPDEVQELLLQAALLPGQRGMTSWSVVRPRIDVDYLPAELHRLIPLLWKALADRGQNDPDLARLKGVYQFSWYRNTMLFAEAAGLLNELAAASIQSMVLRGAAIAIGYRRDAGTRTMNDMDILVPPAEFHRARRVAAAAGWHPAVPAHPLERRLGAAPLRNAMGRMIRLHSLPSANLALPNAPWDGVWKRGVDIRVRDVDSCMLSAADQLVHTCIDGARAGSGASLRWVADAMAVITAPTANLDWDVVVAEARRLRVTLQIGEAMRYLKQALDACVPKTVLGALATTPTTRRDRVSHLLSMTTTPRVAPAAEIIGRFTRFTAEMKVLQAAAVMPDYLATELDVERRRDFPVLVVKRAIRAALSPRPSLASSAVATPEKAKRQW